jgi:pullulanase
MTNGSFCGNEVETRRYMVRRLIIDSLSHFVQTYQIDGFRFDLMGLMDVETMNLIRAALVKINPNIMLYGEGWHMNSMLGEREKASQPNYDLMPNIAHFNDTFRNDIKGDLHGPALGYGTGGTVNHEALKQLLLGSLHKFNDPKYSINYVECHDNSTLFDKLQADLHDTTHLKTYQLFTNALVSLAKGITFYHAGQEMFRTKQGVENSYQSPDYINGLVYDLGPHIDIFKSFIQYQKRTHHVEMSITDFEEGLMIHKGDDIIFIKTTFNPYTYHQKSSILLTSTVDVKTSHEGYVLGDVGVYIFKQ